MFSLLSALLPGFGPVSTAPSEAATFVFTKIADTSTAIPGGTGNFAFFNDPALDGDTVAFVSGVGIYAYLGGSLHKVADKNTAIPGGTGNFQFFGTPSVGSGTIAFRGDGASSQGVYASVGGSLAKVADTITAIPGGVGNFLSFGTPLTVDGGNVVFVGVGSSPQRGVYSFLGGTLTTVVDTSAAIPGGTGNFGGFGSPSADAGDVAFGGFDSSFKEGIYAKLGGSLVKVADTSTPMPGGSGNFVSFGNPSLDGGIVAFLGFRDPFVEEGIYVDAGSVLTVVADTSTGIPGGTGNFVFFSDPAINGGKVAFVGGGAPGEGGLYLSVGGSLTTVIGVGEVLDGKSVAGFSISREALRDNVIAFRAGFADGSEGIFVATADTTPPTVTVTMTPASPPAGQSGYFNAADLAANGGAITLNVSATDDSGVGGLSCTDNGGAVTVQNQSGSNPRTGSFALSGDGIQAILCQATDGATPPNTGAAASSQNTARVMIDGTAPTVTCDTPTSTFVLGGTGGLMTATVVDATSGPVASSVPATVAVADTATVGKKSKLLTGADNAGNETTVTCFYIVAYNFLGFLSPVPLSSYKAGSTIPVKFMLANAAGQKIPDAEARALVSACKVKVGLDSEAPGCATYDAKADTFRFALKTSTTASVGVHTITGKVLAGSDVVNTKTVDVNIHR